jgi:hypothetical protein
MQGGANVRFRPEADIAQALRDGHAFAGSVSRTGSVTCSRNGGQRSRLWNRCTCPSLVSDRVVEALREGGHLVPVRAARLASWGRRMSH